MVYKSCILSQPSCSLHSVEFRYCRYLYEWSNCESVYHDKEMQVLIVLALLFAFFYE